MTDDEDRTDLTDDEWIDVMAGVARLAAADGKRLKITDGPSGPLYAITTEELEP
jgi:hypothetical protein